MRPGAALERLAALAKREDLAHHSLRGDLASFAAGICQYLSTPLASAPTLTRHHSQAEHSNDQPGERALWGVWKQVRVISQLDTDRREKGRPGHRWCLSRPRRAEPGHRVAGHLASSNIAELAKEPKGVHPEQGGSGHACPQPSACPCWAIPAESGNTPARLQPHDTSRVCMHARMDSKARKPLVPEAGPRDRGQVAPGGVSGRAEPSAQLAARLRAGEAWQDNDLIFCEPDRRPWNPDHVSKRFKRLAAALVREAGKEAP